MSTNDDIQSDEGSAAASFEPGDEAYDEASRITPDFVELVELDPSLNPINQVDELELEEAGAELDDPELLVALDGGMDDPDGLDVPATARAHPPEDEGWDLDAPITPGDATDEDATG